jgi:hypothetical protein
MSDRELLELIVRLLETQTKVLEEIRDQLVPPYHATVGGSITVRN